MGFIEWHAGCPVGSTPGTGCMGPTGTYYTIFGTELGNLQLHAAAAIILGAGVFWLLYALSRKGKISFSLWGSAAVALLSAIILFFAFAYLAPVRVVY